MIDVTSENVGPRLAWPSGASKRLFVSRRRERHGDYADLSRDERLLGQGWAPIRRRQFANGRLCARQALTQLGAPPAALLREPSGAPAWPKGVVGSISHSGPDALCMVGPTEDVASIGVDLERVAAVSEDLWDIICTPHEIGLAKRSACPKSAVTRLFCVKEALYKAQHPIFGEWVDYKDLEIDIFESRAVIDIAPHLSSSRLSEKIKIGTSVSDGVAQAYLVIVH